MRATLDIPDTLGAAALDAALEGLVQLCGADLSAWAEELSGSFPALYETGVRYERERGTERWLVPSQVMAAGVGDCEDLAAWRCSELRMSGEDPAAIARVIRSGPRTWHAVVERGDGSIEDPSRILGMGVDDEGSLAGWSVDVRRVPGGKWRCDLTRGDSGVSGVAPYADDAIAHALVLGVAAGEMGFIPGLDILSRAAQGALSAALPGSAPRAPSAPRPPTRPAAPRAPASAEPTHDAIDRIAAQLARITTREARRKVQEAERAASRARSRVVK